MRNVSIHVHTVVLNVAVAPNVWHKIIKPIAFVRPAHKAIHWFLVYVEYANTTKTVWMMKLVIDWIVYAEKSVILIRVLKMHNVKEKTINRCVHVHQDYLEIHMLNVRVNLISPNVQAIQIVHHHWRVWIDDVKIHAPDQMFVMLNKLV